jgi:hypothetical protein
MFEMPDEEKIELITRAFDKFFHDLCVDNELDPVEATAAIQARLTRIALDMGYDELYSRIMDMTKESLAMYKKMNSLSPDSSVH